MSRGAKKLLEIVKEIFPHQKIVLEHNIATRGALFLDIYLPMLDLAFEFDGIQHFEYTEHFHGDRIGFLKSKKRDAEKDEACHNNGITLIRVAYNEDLSKDTVLQKMEEANNG